VETGHYVENIWEDCVSSRSHFVIGCSTRKILKMEKLGWRMTIGALLNDKYDKKNVD